MSAPTPTVLLAGAFGQANPGDESVLDAFLSRLDGCRVSATVARVPSGRAPRYRPVLSADRRAVAAEVLRADLTVATGTVLKTLHPASGRPPLGLLGSTLALAAAARAARRPIAMAGVGAGDLGHPLAPVLARSIVRSAGPIRLRDEESAGLLAAAGVGRPLPVGADVVWATVDPLGSRTGVPARSARRAVIALSHLAGGGELVGALQVAAAGLVASGFEVVLHPWQPGPDTPMAAAVAAGCPAPVRVWDPPPDVPAAARAYAGAALVVGLRFHSLVAAGAAGVPFVAVAHEAKLSGLARRLGQPAVAPTVSGTGLLGAALWAAAGPAAPVAAIEAEAARAAATLDEVRAAAHAAARRRRARPGMGARGPAVPVLE